MTPHPASIAPLPEQEHESRELDRAAATAAALIELAIRESLAPVEALGRALARVAAAPESAAESRAEIAVCIESLQFHDRMVQQLTQVRDLLASAATVRPATTDSRDWPALRERFRAHFTSESHRRLFDLLMHDGGEDAPVPLRAEEGTVELF